MLPISYTPPIIPGWDDGWTRDSRYKSLKLNVLIGFKSARMKWLLRENDDEDFVKCSHKMRKYKCRSYAGQDTWHEGVGRCLRHGGEKEFGRAEAGWLMAHKFAQQLNMSPWDALLMAVRIAAGKVAYIESVLSEAADDRELEGRVLRSEDGILVDPDSGEPLGVGNYRDRSWWVQKGEYWHQRLAVTAKLAIDAGVAERMVEAQVLQVQMMMRPIEAAIAAAQLSPAQEAAARAAMRREILALETEGAVLEGAVVPGVSIPASEL